MALFRPETPKRTLEVAPPEEGLDVPLVREELVVGTDPTSPLAEQFRHMRNSVQALNPEISDNRFIRISCSSCSGNYYFLPGMMPSVSNLTVPCPVCKEPATTGWEVLS